MIQTKPKKKNLATRLRLPFPDDFYLWNGNDQLQHGNPIGSYKIDMKVEHFLLVPIFFSNFHSLPKTPKIESSVIKKKNDFVDSANHRRKHQTPNDASCSCHSQSPFRDR